MPIIKFSGVEKNRVEEYSLKINEISELINASVQNIMFIYEDSEIFPKIDNKSNIYVTVEWMKREDKQEKLATHIYNFFKNDETKVGVFFTDINDKWYVNGTKII